MGYLRIPKRPQGILPGSRAEMAQKAFRGATTPEGHVLKGVVATTTGKVKPIPVFEKRRREIGHDDV